jgi:hypothetical protein
MTLCPGSTTNFCCGNNNTACCGTSSAIVIAAVDGPFTTSTPSPTNQAQNTSPAASTSNSDISKGATTPSGLSGTAKVGIGAGVGAVALIALLGIGVWIMRRKGKLHVEEEIVYDKDAEIEVKPAELPNRGKIHEMAS